MTLERASGDDRSGTISFLGSAGAGKQEMVLTFGASKSDVLYVTETSPDLTEWSVLRSTKTPDDPRTGRVPGGKTMIHIPMSGDQLFARVRAIYEGP